MHGPNPLEVWIPRLPHRKDLPGRIHNQMAAEPNQYKRGRKQPLGHRKSEWKKHLACGLDQTDDGGSFVHQIINKTVQAFIHARQANAATIITKVLRNLSCANRFYEKEREAADQQCCKDPPRNCDTPASKLGGCEDGSGLICCCSQDQNLILSYSAERMSSISDLTYF